MTQRVFAAALTAVLLLTSLAFAQTNNGRIEGTVQDPTGAVIPGAKLVLVNARTQARAEVTSGAQGEYVFTALPAGIYSLTVEAGGFRKAVIQAIELNVGMTVPQIVRLEIGATTESVVVEANAVSVQTTESQVARAVTMRDIDTLPQLARTPITLAVFQPGVQIYAGDSSFSRVNGMRQGANNSKLDGIDANDSVLPRLGLSMTANNTDSIGEFRIVLGAGKAEYGRSAGAQVELITRSGSNEFHGNAFDYHRNTALNANEFFSNQSGGTRPKFIQNLFGGSFGGRAIRDKTFFFGNYQGRRTRQETVRNRTVYTADAKRGIFKWNQGGAVQSFNFAANAANADPRGKGPDPGVAKILGEIPEPNMWDLGDKLNTGGFRFNNPSNSMEDQYTLRGDHQVSATNRAFFRWSGQRNSSIDALNNADATFPGQVHGTQGGTRWGFAVGDDWTISPTIVNEFRIGYQKANADFLRPNRPQGPTLITNRVTDLQYALFPQGRSSPVIDITENLTWLRKRHVFKMGTNIRRTLQYGYNAGGTYPDVRTRVQNGNIVPASIGPAGLSGADRTNFEQQYNDILGRVDEVVMTFYSDLQKFQERGTPRVRNYLFKEAGFFFQDDWKVTRKLTLNLGLRWEIMTPPVERNQFQGEVDKIAQVAALAPATDLTIRRGSHWFDTDWNNFAPRFGFAYDVSGDGRTAIRGNWGVYYDRMIGSVTNLIDGNTPGFSQVVPVWPNQGGAGPANDVRFSDNLPLPTAPAAPVLSLQPTRATSIVLMNPNLRVGYVMNYSLSVQRELMRNTVLEVGYVANRGVKLFMFRDVNQPRVYQELLPAFREMQAYVANNSTAVPASNLFVRLYGSPSAAVSAFGVTAFNQGLLGTVANSLDRNAPNYNRYASAGLPQTFLRLYPQYNQVVFGSNDGRSYYDSLQVSLRRQAGALRTGLNYTWSHAIDSVGAYTSATPGTQSSPEGNGFAPLIDNFNVKLMRGTADFDKRHVFNAHAIYTLPIGKGRRLGANMGRFLDALIGGWDVGSLTIWQSGAPFTVLSQRATGAHTTVTWANYSGSKNIGGIQRKGDGVYFLTAEDLARFSFPAAGEIGTSGRNSFRYPRFFITDFSLVKSFKVTETHAVKFRAEAFNLFNNPNFGGLSTNINTASSFGKMSSTLGTQNTSGSARVLQMTLRYDF